MSHAPEKSGSAPMPSSPEQPGDTPRSVIVNGREQRPQGIHLAELMKNAALLAVPEMVIPFIAAVGRVTMLAAREKLGKSTLAAFVAAVVSRGRELWGYAVEKGTVLWVGLEEEPGDAVRRFSEMGADPNHIVILSRLRPARVIEQLTVEIAAFKPRLVIIDSLAAFFRDIEDENGAAGWTKALMPLVELARTSRAAILVLHHANRSQGSYRGSTAIGASMDMILEMSEPEDKSPVRMIKPRGRWSLKPYTLRYEPSAEWTLIEGGQHDPAFTRAAKVGALQERIHAWLAERAAAALVAEIRAAMGGKAVDCDAALKALVAAGRVRPLGKRKGYEAIKPSKAVSENPKKPTDHFSIEL